MLVLSRKLGERILVPHCDLVVTVLAIEGKTVRLGISAPAEAWPCTGKKSGSDSAKKCMARLRKGRDAGRRGA